MEEITYRAMMGEYIVYYRGKIVDSKDFLSKLFNAMYDELPFPKKKNLSNRLKNLERT